MHTMSKGFVHAILFLLFGVRPVIDTVLDPEHSFFVEHPPTALQL